MKTQLKYIAVIFIAALVTSCQDATDITQKGNITQDKVYENVGDLQLGLNGVYGAYSESSVINFNTIFTDNAKNGKDSNGQNQQLYGHVLNPSTASAGNIWANRYATINFANRVLEGYNKLTFSAADQKQANNVAGQMLALRALCHFDLLEYFGASYIDDSALAVPYIDFVPKDVDIQPTRNTVGDLYSFINDDLDKADSLITSFDNSQRFYIDNDVVEAIRTRVKLFHGNDYPGVEALANDLLTKYPLAQPADYISVFQDQSKAGVIFSLARGLGEGQIASLFYFNSVEFDGDPFVEVSNSLYNILDANDVRTPVLVKSGPNGSVFVGTDSPNNVLLINKYPGSDAGQLVNDVKVFRSGEMILIKAEAQARQGNLPGAAASIKELLDARFGTSQPLPSYANKNAALKDILQQRRIELAYEGHRFLDIKRFRGDLNIGITRNSVDCDSYSADNCDLSKSDYRFTLPIPQNELNANKAIKQNAGY